MHCKALQSIGTGDDAILDKRTNPGTDTSPGAFDVPSDTIIPEPETVPEKLDIRLEYQHERLNCAEHGCIPLRLTNTGEQVIEQIRFTAHCNAFKDYRAPEPRRVNLAKGDSTRLISMDFSICPVPGPYLVNIEGAFIDTSKNPYAFRGVFKIIVRNPQAQRGKLTIEEGYGIDISDNIDFEAVDVIIKDASGVDMSQRDNPEEGWLTIDLELDFQKTCLLREWSRKDQTSIGKPKPRQDSFSTPFVPAKQAVLRTKNKNRGKSIIVWTQRQCYLGRSPSQSDIVCILMPGNERNNSRNIGISRRHCRLKTDGKTVSIADSESTHGTYVDNRQITSSQILNNGQLISLGRLLSLQYKDFRRLADTHEVGKVLNSCRSVFDCTDALASLNLDMLKEKAPLESFRLRRVNNFRKKLEYLFLLTSATIGSSSQCALRLEGESIAKQHARLVMVEREIHLMDLNSPAGTQVNGMRLEPHVPHALGRSADIHIGDVCLTYNVFV
jgi:pSer/pThr/pTyr-binding forkhead associated (FHA) protein